MTTNNTFHGVLPTELLILIIGRIDSDGDLLRCAGVSHQLHNLSLGTLFGRHRVAPLDKDLRLSFSSPDAAIAVLNALAMSLGVVGASLDSLTYDYGWVFDPERLLDELRLLTRYVSKLSSVSQASLRLAAPLSGWPSEWKDANVTLLEAILSRSCHSIRITSIQRSSYHEQDVLSPWKAAITSRALHPSEWTKVYWSSVLGTAPPVHDTTAKPDLRICAIQTFPPFLRQFYLDTLKYNSRTLTDLNFKNIFGAGADWDILIANVYFPTLTRLRFIYGVISRDVMIKFLVKHPTITSFEYHHIRYRTPTIKPVRATFCRNLTALTTTPEHILYFFPPPTKMPQLNNLTINVEQSIRAVFHPLEDCFRRLSPFVGTVLLSLEISRTGLGFGAWFDSFLRPGAAFDPAARPETQLCCVEKLVLDNGDWGFNDGFLSGLPAWLRLFPELREVVLRQNSQRFVSNGSGPLEEELLVKLERECRELRSISVEGAIEWSHSFARPS